jgi:hypothetical protein
MNRSIFLSDQVLASTEELTSGKSSKPKGKINAESKHRQPLSATNE